MGMTLFKTRKCEIVYPVKTEDPENDTLTVGTSLYRKYMGVPHPPPPPPRVCYDMTTTHSIG